MLATSFSDLHIQGGRIFMYPLSIMAVLNILITVFVIFSLVKKNIINPNWLESVKNIGGLAAAWGTWSTIYGLFNIFKALETSENEIPIEMIAGGLQTALITIIYGVLILCLSLLAYIVLKLTASNKAI
jgi:hypothetical protein